MISQINLDMEKIKEFCEKWTIREFSVFGSVLRDDFRPDSDVDVLVEFVPNHGWSLFDHFRMQDELAEMLGRKVDLVSKRAVLSSANKFTRREILNSAQVIYANAG